jgi:hypothetical protein
VWRAFIIYLVSASHQTLYPSSCLVQEGEYIVFSGGTSKACAVAQVVDDGESSVIEDAVNTTYRCSTPRQPL